MAQETAFKKKKKVEVVWRKYKTVVDPSGSKFTTSDLHDQLLTALKEILKIQNKKTFQKDEQEVHIISTHSIAHSTTDTKNPQFSSSLGFSISL